MKLSELVPAALKAERERRQRRREIHRQVAKKEVIRQRIQQLHAQAKTIDGGRDGAANVHTAATEKPQRRLSEITTVYEELIIAGKPLPPALVAEQAALLEEVRQANVVLEVTLKEIKKQHAAVLNQVNALQLEANDYDRIRSQLSADGVGNPELLREIFLARGDVVIWQGQRNIANRDLQRAETAAEQIIEREEHNQHVPDFQKHLAAARKAVERTRWVVEHAEAREKEAMDRVAELREAILDE